MEDFKKIKFPKGLTLQEFADNCKEVSKIMRAAAFNLKDFKISKNK